MSRFIDRISVNGGIPNGLSVEDLYAYSKNLMFDYWEDKDNISQLKKTEALAKKIIEIEDNERAYDNYFFILANSGQFNKVFNECKKLLNVDKFRYFALKNLSDKVFVEKGLLERDKYIEILKERLSVSKSEMERNYVLSLLKEMGYK
ncbi:MAG: hypothetical protein Q4D26_05265 [Clostridia bacterium]|nr:hypothetical protein [Clostridia bacterium]